MHTQKYKKLQSNEEKFKNITKSQNKNLWKKKIGLLSGGNIVIGSILPASVLKNSQKRELVILIANNFPMSRKYKNIENRKNEI